MFWLLSYVLLAGFVHLLSKIMRKPLFVRTQSHHFPWKLNYSVRYWGVEQWLALAISICIVCVFCLVVLHHRGADIKTPGRWLLMALSLCSLWLAVVRLRLVSLFKAHKGWLTALAALFTVVLGLMASAEADAFILQQTRIDPGKFPVGQKMLTFAWLVYAWYWLVSLLISTVLLVGVCWSMIFQRLTWEPHYPPASRSCGVYHRPNKRWHENSWVRMTLLVGLVYTAIAVDALSRESAGSKWRAVQHEILLYASFHLQPGDCAMLGLPTGTHLALIGAQEVMVASPTADAYTYDTQNCPIQSLAQIKKNHDRQIREARARDDFF